MGPGSILPMANCGYWTRKPEIFPVHSLTGKLPIEILWEKSMKTVSFTQMKDGTKKEYEALAVYEKNFTKLTAVRVLAELRRQGEEVGN